MENSEISRIIKRLGDSGFAPIAPKVNISIPNARENLYSVLKYLEPRLRWLPEYEQVAAWLTNNDGRGLLCMGNLGRGKTLICARALPIILNRFCRKIVRLVDARELNKNIDAIGRSHIICIDDVGVEGEYVRYGEHRIAFAELVDKAEKEGKMLIITTNLTVDELTAKYGARTVDRLRAITRVVLFEGESQRGKPNQTVEA